MTKAEQRKAAGKFIYRWKDKGNEDEDGRSYWIELLRGVLGMDHVTERVNFEKKVYVDGNKKRIDAYIPETRVLIEQMVSDQSDNFRRGVRVHSEPGDEKIRRNALHIGRKYS